MSIHVVCPSCLKRFQVGVRFAGMKGPCPHCKAIISIPRESVKIQDVDDTKQTTESDPVLARLCVVRLCAWGILGGLLLAVLLGCIPMYNVLRSLIGTLGLCLIAFPLVFFGYQAVRDREQIFAFTEEELYRRAGLVAAGYAILWIVLEYLLVIVRADVFVSGLYLAAFAGLAALLVHPLLAMRVRDAFLHYCIFGFSVILFRFLVGLGWFWESGDLVRYSTAPPPPFLPGM